MPEETIQETVDQTTEHSGGQEQPETTAEKVEEKMVPQSDVNNLIAKNTKAAKESIFKELGIEDFENAKEGMEKFREWKESQKTEQDKLNEKLSTFESQIGEKDATISDLQAENAAIKSGITDEKNLKAVITLAKTQVSDEVSIEDAIKQVVEDYPQFAGEQKQEEEEKPSFTPGIHTKESKSKGDPFAEKLAKYK